MKPKFVYCGELKVYNERKCKNRGRCIIAREDETWMQVNSKSWGERK